MIMVSNIASIRLEKGEYSENFSVFIQFFKEDAFSIPLENVEIKDLILYLSRPSYSSSAKGEKSKKIKLAFIEHNANLIANSIYEELFKVIEIKISKFQFISGLREMILYVINKFKKMR